LIRGAARARRRALLVLTFRAGEAPPGHRLHAVVGGIRASDAVVLDLAPLSQAAVASLAGDDAGEVYAAAGTFSLALTSSAGTRARP
jgi:hypothetical protein